jgi:hypothetical protein
LAPSLHRDPEFDPERLGLRGDDVFWMLLSFLALGPDEQRVLLPPIPARADPRARELEHNPLFALVYAFHYYMPAWCRSVDPGRDLVWPLDESIEELALPSDDAGDLCVESFISAEIWGHIRREAGVVLTESGLGPHPIPNPLPLRELIAPPT